MNLSYDFIHHRFVFALLDSASNIWYGYSTDASGTSWVFGNLVGGTPKAVFTAAGSTEWDYPSIGVDSSGRVIVGGVLFSTSTSYYAAVSGNGQNFPAPSLVTASGGDFPGTSSRVVAAGGTFHAFLAVRELDGLPTGVNRYQSSDGVNWSGPIRSWHRFRPR